MINFIKRLKYKNKIRTSNLFDSKFYLFTYTDVKVADIDPITHYVNIGAKEGRNPNTTFDTQFYLNTYSDVKDSGINPFYHYIVQGCKEGKQQNQFEFEKHLLSTHSSFDVDFYLEKYPDIKAANIDPIEHFMTSGYKEGRNPSKEFDNKFYINRYNILKNVNPLIHFITHGENLEYITNKEQEVHNQVIPYYLDETKTDKFFTLDGSIAIHLYVDDIINFDLLLNRLNALETFDLFISMQEGLSTSDLEVSITAKLFHVNSLSIIEVTSATNSLEALIVEHGNSLLKYTYMGHFHTNFKNINCLDPLLDTDGNNIDTILSLLQKDAKIVYNEDRSKSQINDPSGWYGHFDKAKTLIENDSILNINDFKMIDYPKTGMFWAKNECLKKFLNLDDVAKKNREILKPLLVIYSKNYSGNIYRIQTGNTLKDYSYYEEQIDYSTSIEHQDIKVLSYYLGQFHPIPENDEWHGKGFTEWTNVKRANPLFEGHYQQHIPHEDLGYYILDNPEILKKQADMMKKSGVYGQIFYHYWFTGKLILEKPAQMLLENKDIDMPFCFCWANENWTRRWDGEDDDVLLGQVYSEEDAREFIKYLIPFFQDSRYIRIENRPVLYIYRSTSIPTPEQYIQIWAEECAKASISSPYLVTVLTRGATNSNDFGMDAGVERILFDWTDGAVPDIRNSLETYKELTGNIIDYSQVASFYEKQTEEKDFTYFRSISPVWDNTARYQEGAYLLHKSTPKRFQTWFENLIEYTERTLSPDKQFIVVNAWNEWAEGAHLEPDTYYGYSYLNSIGRALSNKDYHEKQANIELEVKSKIYITMSSFAQKELKKDHILKQQFIACLTSSSIFKEDFLFYSDVEILINECSTIKYEEKDDKSITIHFQNISLFDSEAIENMLNTSSNYKDSIIVSNTYGDKNIYEVTENNSIDAAVLYSASIHVKRKENSKNVRISLNSRCFLAYANNKTLSEVISIIRFHKSGDINELKNALFCLCAMQNIRVTALITAQDLDNNKQEELNTLINKLPLKDVNDITITYYNSPNGNGDLRTQMLNESLLNTKTRYVAFLDYDDVLFPKAYTYLIERLKQTKKSIAMGRVFYTSYDSEKSLIIKREKNFEYGYTYDEFVDHNHAPIHSFMLDLKGIDLSKVIYHDDQCYMEDYYLTLQLFTQDNADWEGLSNDVYIGDYIHCTDRDQTLAIHCDEERNTLLNDDNYKRDQNRISILQSQLNND